MNTPIPASLPLLPLPPESVLFPSLVSSVQLESRHAVELIRSVVKDASSVSSSGSPASSSLVIGCVPLKANNTVANALSDAVNRTKPKGEDVGGDNAKGRKDGEDAVADRKKGLQVIRVPVEGVKNAGGLGDEKPEPGDLFEFGVAARIVRLERLSASSGGGFLVVVEGLARFSFDPSTLSSSSPFYTAPVTVHPATSLSSGQGALLAALRDTTTSLLDTLQAVSPLPPIFARRLRSLVARLTLSSAPALVDALMGTLPVSATGGVTHSDKLLILSTADASARVEEALEILSRVDEALKLSKRIDDKVDKNVARRQREYVLMQQLLAIRQELDDLAAEDGRTGNASSSPAQPKGVPAAPRRKRLPASTGSGSPITGEDEDEDDIAELEKKIEAKAFSAEARKVAMRELKRLKKSPPQGAEHGVIRTYLETLLSLPWTSADSTPISLSKDFVAQARKKLDEDHYGLDKIKKRLLEWLAVLRLQQQQWDATLAASASAQSAAPAAITDAAVTETAVVVRDPATPPPPAIPAPSTIPARPPYKAPILLLHGPPGVGKTSIARSLAEAMGRKFVRISLGGVRDESEIRGHRRTFVASMPGKIVNALRRCGTNNPVILLDEIDKLGHASLHGDPSAAMLEVLDPEQNAHFEDHYLGVPIDLSQVLFIATANSLDTISEPLYDRMEAIELSGYIHDEKLHIARQSLLPKQLRANALTPSLISLSDETILYLITHYTREAGVRSLERQIGSVCRAKAVEYAEARDAVKGENKEGEVPEGYKVEVTKEDIERMLGPSRFDPDELEKEARIGVVNGLAYQGSGNGGILHIETTSHPGTGAFHLTGSLGDVISESAHVAFAWVKAHAYELGISHARDEDVFKRLDVHLHLPAGAVKKDGPSAGVAMVVALVSLMRGIAPRKGIAMTGEITLRGAVTPVGGIREKVLAAHRAHLTRLILPMHNKRDVESDLPSSVREEIDFVFVERVEEVVEAAFEGGWRGFTTGGGGGGGGGEVWQERESRL
ncbi:Lon protease-like protein [Rhodotorula toruloides]|uniref:Lon protease homolog n=1 Tax=Rhodotorula toruloides TaxID=5286 RepID=A0A0K3CLE1_RHOTO|nr:Lon protease-like protein [Rhodotorula toruloides]